MIVSSKLDNLRRGDLRVWYILRHMEQYLQDVYELKVRREKSLFTMVPFFASTKERH